MPTYQYLCRNCNYEFEKMQSIVSEPLKKCPNCNKITLKKVITGGAGLIFKGSGFYITDYKKTDHKSKKHKESLPEIKAETKPKPDKKTK